ncbi:MAG TPA: hypothetical protein VNT32_15540 [Thermoleophilaceae bacterium]|nr:hypothetical protein [Thermoleophilaceae bacterium]
MAAVLAAARGEPPRPSPAPPAGGVPAGLVVTPAGLSERRRELARELCELQWDLGGLAYEMAVRDHFRLDVLVTRAARLQEVDADLGEVERMLRLDEAGAAGTCGTCQAMHSRGAAFCWRCGSQLLEPVPAEAVGR